MVMDGSLASSSMDRESGLSTMPPAVVHDLVSVQLMLDSETAHGIACSACVVPQLCGKHQREKRLPIPVSSTTSQPVRTAYSLLCVCADTVSSLRTDTVLSAKLAKITRTDVKPVGVPQELRHRPVIAHIVQRRRRDEAPLHERVGRRLHIERVPGQASGAA